MNELKTNIIYEVITSKKDIEDVGLIQVYGIDVHKEWTQGFCTEEDQCCIEDISSDYSYVKDLTDYLADHQALPEHIFDIVSDYIAVV